MKDGLNVWGSWGRKAGLWAGLWLVAGVLAGIWLARESRSLGPQGMRLSVFDDALEGGRSRASVSTGSQGMVLDIQLDASAAVPFAGGIVHLEHLDPLLDLSHGVLELELGASNLPALRVCLLEELPGFSRPDRWETYRYECADRELVPGTTRYRIPAADFTTPGWWYASSGTRLSQLGPERRERIVRLILQGDDATPRGTPLRLELRSLRMRVHDSRVLVWGILAGLCAAFVQVLVSYRRRPHLVSLVASLEATSPEGKISFEPLEATSYADREREAVVACIGRDYSDPDLTLEKVARSTGVPVDRVTTHVRAASGLLFKAYLNRVRVESARLLLLETDLPVSEIAQRVGYGSVPHFNRVFKELHETTPTALREASKPTGEPKVSEDVVP